MKKTTNKDNKKTFGFILVDKPAGISSFGVIARLRKVTGVKKIGHAGTLDPFATGLLIVAIGREATREIDKYIKLDKEYEAVMDLSKSTDTYDKDGKITFEYEKELEEEKLKETLKDFTGEQKQIPPMFSAKKIKGKKLYELARKGKSVKRDPADIFIHKIKLLYYKWPQAFILVQVSSGTYIRALARDVGRVLGSGACLQKLKRTKIGDFSLTEAKSLDKINKENWQSFLFGCQDLG